MSAKYDIEIDQGSDIIFPIQLEDANNVEQDLTSYSAKMQIRISTYSAKPLDELSTENKRILIKEDPTSKQLNSDGSKPKSILECHWSNEVTSAFPPGNHVYDLELISSDNKITRILEGKFKVSREVTR